VVLEKDGDDELNRSCEKLDRTHRVREERNIAHKVKRRQANSIGHILRRNDLLKDVIEGMTQKNEKIEEEDVSSYSMAFRKIIDIGI
jgi:hypothetical protein